MWFWQRKEIWVGTSLGEFNRRREILDRNEIQYDYRMSDRMTFDPGRKIGALGRAGTDVSCSVIYSLYVRRENFDWAVRLINSGEKT